MKELDIASIALVVGGSDDPTDQPPVTVTHPGFAGDTSGGGSSKSGDNNQENNGNYRAF